MHKEIERHRVMMSGGAVVFSGSIIKPHEFLGSVPEKGEEKHDDE